MAPSAPELVRAAMRELGLEGQYSEFARALGMGIHAPRKIKNWLEGVHEPDYKATMAMLEAVGWLNVEGNPQAANASQVPEDPLERAIVRLAALANEMVQVADDLQELRRPQASGRGKRKPR